MEKKTLTIIMGETCSGKTTLLKELVDLGLPVLKQITTRTKRSYPKVDEYIFSSVSHYSERLERGKIVGNFEVDGIDDWFYGFDVATLEELQERDMVCIANPLGYRGLGQYCKDNNIRLVVYFLKASPKTRAMRMLDRGDKLSEVNRRINYDLGLYKAMYLEPFNFIEEGFNVVELAREIYAGEGDSLKGDICSALDFELKKRVDETLESIAFLLEKYSKKGKVHSYNFYEGKTFNYDFIVFKEDTIPRAYASLSKTGELLEFKLLADSSKYYRHEEDTFAKLLGIEI